MNDFEYYPTKGERRESKASKLRRMVVSGVGLCETEQLIGRKAQKVKEQHAKQQEE